MQRHEFQFRWLTRMVVAALAIIGTSHAQLAFHNDPSQNSFSIKLPAFQQTFTRYFGNQPHGALLQQQQQQQELHQQQRLQQKPYTSTLQQQSNLYQAQPHQQQQQEHQPESFNRLVAQFPNQPHYSVQENYINPNILLRSQQQRYQQQQQQYQPEPQYQGYPVQPSGPAAQEAGSYATTNHQPQYEYIQQQQQAQQQQLIQQQQLQEQNHGLQRTPAQPDQQPGMLGDKLVSTAYSPSNEVSQVQFSSGSLKYNF
ncbi:serum response factor homolog A-like [Anopheles aquasalis]|uniref:serum response factor homolog A-like n=1 Tax=Anopheles aquasalis TaxID=42839 RepID=UPI00215A5100|nr:serum response factor homolog A-like [Anopheles aquasalis]